MPENLNLPGDPSRSGRMFRCRVNKLLVVDGVPFHIERMVDLPFVPRAGDWLFDYNHLDDGSCWSDGGMEIRRVGICVSTGEVLLECGIDTDAGGSVEEAMTWHPGFVVV